MENNRNFPARQFHSLTFFAGLCIGITPVAQALAAEGQTNADDTLVVEASTPSLYAPQQSADPKFSRPVADTTRTMTVISEQVIKDQGATNLTDALKNVPGVGAFLWVRTVTPPLATPFICVVPIPLTVFILMAFAISAASRATPSIPSRSK